jgi:predicted nucleic acid-binding protein
MNILADTSVWIAHFRSKSVHLQHLLAADRIVCHPFVRGEIAYGIPPAPRVRPLQWLALLQQPKQATHSEVLGLIEAEQLYGLGCGWVDVNLLASVRLTPNTRLWTLDKRLAAQASRLGIDYSPQLH